MNARTKRMGLALVMLCGALIMSIPTTASAEEPTLQSIVTEVSNAENSIQDIKIEYTCIRKPYGVDPNWQPSANERYPGWWKQETGVWQQKGDKIRLDRTYYKTTSATEQIEESTAYNGTNTKYIEPVTKSLTLGKVNSGRWHGFRKWFNPVLALSATGDTKLSSELANMDAEIQEGSYTINRVSCKLVKLYKKTPKGTILRSFNVYLDPSSNYAPIKVEEYWNNFQCLERTVEVKELTKVGDVYVPTKAICITYNRPHASQTSNAVTQQELTTTNIKVNQGISDSAFELSFAPGTKVWDDTIAIKYIVPELEPEP